MDTLAILTLLEREGRDQGRQWLLKRNLYEVSERRQNAGNRTHGTKNTTWTTLQSLDDIYYM